MGRNVEKMMLHVLSGGAQAGGAKSLSVEYQPTSKNQPCLQFFQGSGLSGAVGGALFTLDLSKAYARPSAVRLELAPGIEVVSGGST
jgi:predicted enzyme involved in methoxymalonyl-ACP biosynthesis